MEAFAAVVLTGGGARRMGGIDKPAVPVGGQPMRDRVLDAVSGASARIVVGPATGLPPDVRHTREDPPGGGPVAATEAGLALLDPDPPTTVLLAADLPLLTAEAVRSLVEHVSGAAVDGAVYLDDGGRRQLLCGAWRTAALRAALARVRAGRGGTLAGASIRGLVADLTVAELSWTRSGPPPWWDCDTDDDVRRAEEWIR
ncbi:NTP transferase domain-containing protein [Micromonospora sp. NPDC049559]|uniref:molybdenum cofactor guanylyltransferase n=1 Tax=Micromonospora sp. NPDC049559 TaxID=3155923 RepID=UPI00342EB145